MQRVWRPGCEFRVDAGGRQRQLRELRIVEAVNEIVRDARMLRLMRQYAIENLRSFLLIRVRLVVRRCDAKQGERVEDRGFVILWIRARHIRHRLFVREHACAVSELVGICIEGVDRVDECLLARRFRVDLLRFRGGLPSGPQFIRRGSCPERMQIGHCRAPPGHAALRVCIRCAAERLLRLDIPERMYERDAAIDLLLRCSIARSSQTHRPDVSEIVGAMLVLRMSVVREEGKRCAEDRREEDAH